jgi:hypothetical protein
MFALFARHYNGVSRSAFDRDLHGKSHVILVRNHNQQICGFSTLSVDDHMLDGNTYRVFFSGDTIVDPAYWGGRQLFTAWLGLVGQLLRDCDLPAIWLLTTKGHRTYRLLPLWFKSFYPSVDAGPDTANLERIAHSIGMLRYKTRYDPNTNVIHRGKHGDCLADHLVEVPTKDALRRDVRYFLSRNPGFVHGDELLCVADITQENMTKFSARAFLSGTGELPHGG